MSTQPLLPSHEEHAQTPQGSEISGSPSQGRSKGWAALQALTSVPLGSSVTVAEIKVSPESRPRLMEMGLLVGTAVELVRFAPLGDPVEIKVRGYHLTLRKHEAEQIFVRV